MGCLRVVEERRLVVVCWRAEAGADLGDLADLAVFFWGVVTSGVFWGDKAGSGAGDAGGGRIRVEIACNSSRTAVLVWKKIR